MTDRDTGERPELAYVVNALQEVAGDLRVEGDEVLLQRDIAKVDLPEGIAAVSIGEIDLEGTEQFVVVAKHVPDLYAVLERDVYLLAQGDGEHFTVKQYFSEEQLQTIEKHAQFSLEWRRAVESLGIDRMSEEEARAERAHRSILEAVSALHDLMDQYAAGEISEVELDEQAENTTVDYGLRKDGALELSVYDRIYLRYILALEEYEALMAGVDRDLDAELADIIDGDTPLSETTERKTFGAAEAWALLSFLESIQRRQ